MYSKCRKGIGWWSGGGPITILYGGTITNNGTINASGGAGGSCASSVGGSGGAGSIRYIKIQPNTLPPKIDNKDPMHKTPFEESIVHSKRRSYDFIRFICQGGSHSIRCDSGAWRNRYINLKTWDDTKEAFIDGVYSMFLPKGRYYVNAITNAYYVNYSVNRLYNITDDVELVRGMIMRYYNNSTNTYSSFSQELRGMFTLEESKQLLLQQYVDVSQPNYGQGIGNISFAPSLYTIISFFRFPL